MAENETRPRTNARAALCLRLKPNLGRNTQLEVVKSTVSGSGKKAPAGSAWPLDPPSGPFDR